MDYTHRWLLLFFLALILFNGMCAIARGAEDKAKAESGEQTKPNFVIIFADDLGYGDLTCYGHPTIATPNLDKMAHQGQKWTCFYTAASVCTPSRTGLLTGRLPIRSGMCSMKRRVLFPNSKGGIPERELLLSEALKQQGYATGCFGKWHLGHLKPYLPTSNGFDTYFGIPYSNDMDRVTKLKNRGEFWNPKSKYFNVPLMRDFDIVERPAEQTTITRRYTEEAIKFIKKNQERPFFVYLPHNLPHVPLFRGKAYENKSRAGLYGDVIEEIDWSVGQIMDTLKELKLDQKTYVMFTSDNGPWLIFNDHGGSAGLLRDGKGSTYEGGFRVPFVVWGPGNVKPGVVRDMGSTLDIMPTLVNLAGGKLPTDRQYDGGDLSAVWKDPAKPSPREEMFFYRGDKLFATRVGKHKVHFITRPAYGKGKQEALKTPAVYDLENDPREKFLLKENIASIVDKARKVSDAHTASVKTVENQLEK